MFSEGFGGEMEKLVGEQHLRSFTYLTFTPKIIYANWDKHWENY